MIPESQYHTLSMVISADWRNLDISLSPCPPLLVDRSDEVYSLENVPPVKEFIGTLPESPVAIYDHQIYRDRKIVYVTTMPVKCIDNKDTFVCDKLVYRINFIPSEEKRDPKKILHEVDEDFMASLFDSTIYGDKKAGRYFPDGKKKPKPAPTEKKVSKPVTPKSKFPIPNTNQRKN